MKSINEVFIEKPNTEVVPETDTTLEKSLLRFISLIDAFIMRNETDRAFEILHQARKKFGQSDEIERRWQLLSQQCGEPDFEEEEPIVPLEEIERKGNQPLQDRLEKLLHRVIDWKKEVGPS